ncbi:TetR/AcrR family transcriptional regulator [Phenylobacterium sp.]|uniref:TetR/AcrR family transcriptional regulator n=1 Tax=Phenylobacterium sp. TaxID=1871053 RepID=UPI0025CD385E|nr:TetR/AcrR family transcriptional regulator [Phenylobacterium sp.]
MTETSPDRSPPAAKSGRGARTREALIRAGRALFAERPVDAVAIDDIVQAAEVAKGSFYNHFADREALVKAVVYEIREALERRVGAVNADVTDPARRVARAVCVYQRYAVDEPQRAKVLVRIQSGFARTDEPMNRGVAADVSAGLAAGRFVIATVEAGVLYVTGVSQAALARTCRNPDVSAAVSLSQQMCALILRGLGVPAAEAETLAAQASDELVRRPGAG